MFKIKLMHSYFDELEIYLAASNLLWKIHKVKIGS